MTELVKSGLNKIKWCEKNMPILAEIEKDFLKNQYFKGLKILVCVHMEGKTARLVKLLRDGGAEVFACGCNPLSTQDDVAAALNTLDHITVFAKHGSTEQEYFGYIESALKQEPQIIIDDGGDVVHLLHTKYQHLLPNIYGGGEETTTGIARLRSMERAGTLKMPMFSINDADCKHLFDNRYGTGQSVWDGINRTTNLVVAGKTVVVAGYGWCGKGVCMRAKGFGAKVVVCEVDPVKAIEAVMDGFTVLPMAEAASVGDFFITVTGCRDVITKEHFVKMKDGAILANAGHFDVEINLVELAEIAIEKTEPRANVEGYLLPDGKQLNVLAQGRLVNLAAGDGHPAEIMDMSFALQALCAKYVAEHRDELSCRLYPVPAEIDRYVAKVKLKTLGISIDRLTKEQIQYLMEEQG